MKIFYLCKNSVSVGIHGFCPEDSGYSITPHADSEVEFNAVIDGLIEDLENTRKLAKIRFRKISNERFWKNEEETRRMLL